MQENIAQEILEAVHLLSDNMDMRLANMDKKIDTIDNRLDRVENRLDHVENQMVTKSYLDDKLADLKGELITISHKTNTKLSVLVERLVDQGSLGRVAADQILSLEPFPQ